MEFLTQFILPSLWGFVGCIGFCLVFNIQGAGILICGLGGGLGWFAYLAAKALLGSSMLAAFLAAALIALFSEIMARVRRCPVTGYLQIALLPLVPGAGIYYAMRYCVAGETDQFLSTLLSTFGMAAALAVGAMLTSTVLRILLPHIHGEKRNSRS